MHYLFLFDCDNIDAARVFVSSLYLLLFNTLDAFVSMSAPVCFEVFDCESTDAAKLFAVTDEVLSFNVFTAKDVSFGDDFFLFVMT
jgi:hypothetical protein